MSAAKDGAWFEEKLVHGNVSVWLRGWILRGGNESHRHPANPVADSERCKVRANVPVWFSQMVPDGPDDGISGAIRLTSGKSTTNSGIITLTTGASTSDGTGAGGSIIASEIGRASCRERV